jgi:hypothetical protein
MRSTKERLQQSVALLEKLDLRRSDMHSPAHGADTEWSLIEQELQELEKDIVQEPGALERFLVRTRPTQ